ncbi:MAG: hypothetical protein E4G90_07855, partial [Gemmatimonadales bacterium]
PGEFRLVSCTATSLGLSPYRLIDAAGSEIAAVNGFLDAQAARGLSPCSLRAYGYSLLNLWRWLFQEGRALEDIEEPDLLDYIRFQRGGGEKTARKASAKTINHRLTATRCLYRFCHGDDLPAGRRGFPRRSHPYHSAVASETGYLHPSRPRALQLRVKEPRTLVLPLSPTEVGRFLEGLRTWRDLAIAGLMLLCGLRSREMIAALLRDLFLSDGELRVRGKGGKERVVPLAPQVTASLDSYLTLERPKKASESLFVVLKGPRRGHPLTPAGLRSLFRYHRVSSGVAAANPHRFRHTFGSDMARAGMSLPALMRLMGHADIHTTMLYVEISPKDVWEEFHRVTRSRLMDSRSPQEDPS